MYIDKIFVSESVGLSIVVKVCFAMSFSPEEEREIWVPWGWGLGRLTFCHAAAGGREVRHLYNYSKYSSGLRSSVLTKDIVKFEDKHHCF